MVAPIEAHLARRPGDWTGAFAVMLETISGGEADLTSAAVARQMVNAEAAVRDDAAIITQYDFGPGSLAADRVRLARCRKASDLHAAVVDRLAARHGLAVIDVDAATDHEVYLSSRPCSPGWTGAGDEPSAALTARRHRRRRRDRVPDGGAIVG